MASVMDAVALTIRQTISDGIKEALPGVDETTGDILQTDVGVEREGIGRDWKVRHTFAGSIAGTHWWRAAAGGTVLNASASDGTFVTYDSTALQAYPGYDEMTAPGFYQKTITLVAGVGGFTIPNNIFRSDMLPSSIGPVVSETVKGAALRAAMSQAHAFWKMGVNGSVASFAAPASSEDIDTTGQYYTVNGGRIRQLQPGMIFDIATSASSTSKVNTPKVYVDRVDFLQKKVWLKTMTSSVNLTASTTYFLVPYQPSATIPTTTANTLPSGLTDWIVSSGTVFGIDTAVHPQHRSLIADVGGVALSSLLLNKHVGGLIQAYNAELDNLITTEGVLVGLLEDVESASQLVRYQVQGEALNVQQGFEKVGYRYGGKVIKLRTSHLCPDGTLYGLKLGSGNIRKYVPPKLKGTASSPGFDGEIEFVGQRLGSPNIFLPVHNSSAAYTDQMVAPYENWMEFCPRVIPGLKLTNISESIATG